MSVVTTEAVLLRSHAYSETSRVLRFYSERLGVVGVMAKGVRSRGGKRGDPLETFAEGSLTIYVKDTRGLQTFKDFSPTTKRRSLGSDVLRFASASVVGELVLKHAGEEASPELFHGLSGALDRLQMVPSEAVLATLLSQAWALVSLLGYHPVVESCVICERVLGESEMGRFDFGQGGVACASCAAPSSGPRVGPDARVQLSTLLRGRIPSDLRQVRNHVRLLSDFVTYHVSGSHPLRSFAFLEGMVPADHGGTRSDA